MDGEEEMICIAVKSQVSTGKEERKEKKDCGRWEVGGLMAVDGKFSIIHEV